MALNINGTTGISGVDGSASAPALQGTDSNTGINFGTDTVNINTGGTTRVTVDSSGFLGVGTTSPSSFNADGRNLVVGTGSGGQGLSIYSANNNYGNIYFADGTSDGSYNAGGILYNHSSNFMRFDTAAGEKMRIDSNGHIGLSPNGIDPSSTGGITVRQSDPATAGPVMSFNTIPANQGFTEFRSSGTQIGSIGKSGTTGVSYYSASDYRLKENESLIIDGITRLKILKPYRFNWKADASTKVDGFFAHEVTPAVPEAITGEKDAVDSNNDPIIQQIDQSKLIPLLTAALQEAVAKIEVLETKVAALEAA